MSEAVLIYLYLIIGNFIVFLSFIVFSAGFFYTLLGVFKLMNSEDLKETVTCLSKYKIKMYLIVMLATGLVTSLYPSKKDIGFIIGGATIYNAVDGEEAKKLPNNILKAMNGFLEGIEDDSNNKAR